MYSRISFISSYLNLFSDYANRRDLLSFLASKIRKKVEITFSITEKLKKIEPLYIIFFIFNIKTSQNHVYYFPFWKVPRY